MSRLFKFAFLIVLIFVFAVSPVMAQDDVVPDGESITVQIPAEEPTFWNVAPILFSFGTLAVVVIWMIIQGKNPAEIDKYASEGIAGLQHDRKLMEILETLVQKQPTLQDFVESTGKFISGISDHLPGITDKTVGGFLQDIAAPGAPDDLTAHASEAFVASNRTMTAEDWGNWDQFMDWFKVFKESGAFGAFAVNPTEEGQEAAEGFADALINIIAEGDDNE